jgi:hypothetical protein
LDEGGGWFAGRRVAGARPTAVGARRHRFEPDAQLLAPVGGGRGMRSDMGGFRVRGLSVWSMGRSIWLGENGSELCLGWVWVGFGLGWVWVGFGLGVGGGGRERPREVPDLELRRVAGRPCSMSGELEFEGGKEALGGGVVETVALDLVAHLSTTLLRIGGDDLLDRRTLRARTRAGLHRRALHCRASAVLRMWRRREVRARERPLRRGARRGRNIQPLHGPLW